MNAKAHARKISAIQQLIESSLYQVDSDGSIWTKKTPYGRVLNNGHWRKINDTGANGKEFVRISGKKFLVAEIVYQKFHKPPQASSVVVHKDGNIKNNHFKNLCLQTKEEQLRGPKLELIDLQTRREIKLAYKLGLKTSELVAKFGLKPAQLNAVLRSKAASA